MSEHISRGFEPARLTPGPVAGWNSIECRSANLDCECGTPDAFGPGEHHTLRAPSDTRLFLLLTSTTGETHDSDVSDGNRLYLLFISADEILVTRPSRRSGSLTGGGRRREGASALRSADHPRLGIRRRIALDTVPVAANGAG